MMPRPSIRRESPTGASKHSRQRSNPPSLAVPLSCSCPEHVPWGHRRGPAQLVVRRNGALVPLQLAGDLGCGGEVALVRSNSSNAWTDGRRVVVTTGVLRVVPKPDV